MYNFQDMLNELVDEGWVTCVHDVESGYYYYSASKKVNPTATIVRSFLIEEAKASCELDRDGTFSIG